jgi:hypothetical protein
MTAVHDLRDEGRKSEPDYPRIPGIVDVDRTPLALSDARRHESFPLRYGPHPLGIAADAALCGLRKLTTARVYVRDLASRIRRYRRAFRNRSFR